MKSSRCKIIIISSLILVGLGYAFSQGTGGQKKKTIIKKENTVSKKQTNHPKKGILRGFHSSSNTVIKHLPKTESDTLYSEIVKDSIQNVVNEDDAVNTDDNLSKRILDNTYHTTGREDFIREKYRTPEKIFNLTDSLAEFPGGQAELMLWLSQNIRYPESAQQNGISGRVVVKCIIEKDGSIRGPVVVKGVDRDLDQEAIRVVKSMPKWIPAKNNGEPVRSYYSIPITFRLRDM